MDEKVIGMRTEPGRAGGEMTVRAVLRGGPADLPREKRTCYTQRGTRKIKIMHYGGYEHFERDDDAGGDGSPTEVVFQWTTRTRMAE